MFVEERAISYLEKPETYPSLEPWAEVELVFRVWVYEIDWYGSWLLRQTKNAFWVRRLQWDRSQDSLTSLGEPGIYGSQAIVPDDLANNMVGQIQRFSVLPFMKPQRFGIDGTIFGVETKSLFLNGRLSWWSEPPESWQPLAAWLKETVNHFDSLLPESTARMSHSERMERWKRFVASQSAKNTGRK